MATITIEIKDAYLDGIGEYFGNRSNPIEAITEKFNQDLVGAYDYAIANYDPDVVQKRQEYEAIVEQKKQETKEVKEGEIKR